MKKPLFLVSTMTIVSLIFLSNLNSTDASSSLPNIGNAGAPMDNAGQTCTSCHAGTATQTTGVISSDIPGTGYVGGTTYNFTVTMSGAAAYGYEITPQTATSNVGLGTLISAPGSSVSTKYVRQSVKKTGASAVWTFKWTAPATAPSVTFYGSFNYANNNNSDTGDLIKKSSVTYFASATGIEEQTISSNIISVFPNPATELLNVLSQDQFENGSVFSLDGKLVKTVSQHELLNKSISVSDLNAGIYYLQMNSQVRKYVSKFSKN